MTDEIQILIDSLKRGQYENPAEKIGLLSAALREPPADVELLLSLLRAPQVPLQLAAMDASRGRSEPQILTQLVSMIGHVDVRVRLKLPELLSAHSSNTAIDALRTLHEDAEEDVRVAAMKSTAGRLEFYTLHERLTGDSYWIVRVAAVNALELQKTPAIVKTLLSVLQREDNEIGRRCAEIIENRLSASLEATETHLAADTQQLAKAEKHLKDFGADRFPKLMCWLTARTAVNVDLGVIGRLGTDLTASAIDGALLHAHHVEEQCANIIKLLHREPWRSIALVGPAGVGKTAVVNELTYLLARPENGAWRVLRMSPADFMAGTKYLGEWETRVREVVEAIRKPRRVLLYVPNLSDLSSAGVWSKSDANVATAIAPYLEDGSIVILGESTPEEYERGIGRITTLRRLFDKVLLQESTPERTRDILNAIREEEKSNLPAAVVDRLQEASFQFLNHMSRPGNAIELLRAVIKSEKHSSKPVGFRDVLDSLSKSTGIPGDLLDDSMPLRTDEIRTFFEKRIVGQPEAVEAVVDLITLIKAGVTDPNKPFAVFLFVGPTGVGKTELARSLAEFIFGDAGRLKRFDMSEFASHDGFQRLIGTNNESGLLTDAVRHHPFSVVLLDEIEKSHVNVFDLCLQIFDAGRLTDGRGRTADFRRTILILTSNIGATMGLTTMGFGTGESAEVGDPIRDRSRRELSRFFRPEFLNRLDRIVQFRPLSIQVAEQIARREIDAVLQRSGIQRRSLVVDVDAGVISLLVREGYSPHLGARPLKRTVERLLLLPLARAIAAGTLGEQPLVRLTERDGRVQVVTTAAAARKTTPAIKEDRSRSLLKSQINELEERFGDLEGPIRRLKDRKSELILQTQDPYFFQNADVRIATYNEIHNLDQFMQLHLEVGASIAALTERLGRSASSRSDDTGLNERIDAVARELDHLASVSHCDDARDLGDSIISIALVNRNGETQNGVEKLARMYEGLAVRHRLTSEILGEFYNNRQDRAYLLIAGLGAYGLLKNESGLHQIDRRFKERTPRSGREVIRQHREMLRVEVHASTHSAGREFQKQAKVRVELLKPIRKRLIQAGASVSVFHEPSVRSLELWTSGSSQEVIDKSLSILQAELETKTPVDESLPIIREYDIGMSARVKDNRTGRNTTRVNRVFKGDLGALRM